MVLLDQRVAHHLDQGQRGDGHHPDLQWPPPMKLPLGLKHATIKQNHCWIIGQQKKLALTLPAFLHVSICPSSCKRRYWNLVYLFNIVLVARLDLFHLRSCWCSTGLLFICLMSCWWLDSIYFIFSPVFARRRVDGTFVYLFDVVLVA